MTQTVNFAVDFYARVQTVAYCHSQDGEIHVEEFAHFNDDIRSFHNFLAAKSSASKPVVIVIGLNACLKNWDARFGLVMRLTSAFALAAARKMTGAMPS
jgi:hypothetical protein